MKAKESTSCSKKNKKNLDSVHTAEHIEKAQKRAKKHFQKKCETEYEKSSADSTFSSTKHDINNQKVSNVDSSSDKKRKSKDNFDSEYVTKRTKRENSEHFLENEIKSEISSDDSDYNSIKHVNKNIEKETHSHFRKKCETEYEKSSIDSPFVSKKHDIKNKKVSNGDSSSDKKRKSKNFDSENVTKRTKKENSAHFLENEIKSEISSDDSDCNSIKHVNKNIEKETHSHFRKKCETEYEKSSIDSPFVSKKHDIKNKKVSNGDSSSDKKRKSKNFDSENVTKRTKKENSAHFLENEIKSEISSDDSDCNSIKHVNKNIEKETHSHFRKKCETEYEKSSADSTFTSKKPDINNKKVSNSDPSSDKKKNSKDNFDSEYVTKRTKKENSAHFLMNEIISEICSDDSDCNSIDYDDDNKNVSNNDLENELELLITSNQENPPKIRDKKFFKKLRKIDIDWILPVLHKMATQVVRLPEPDVREQIKKLEIPWKRGYFSPEEDKIIKDNWDNLCKTYRLPDTPEVLAHFRNVENNSTLRKIRRMAVLWLARDLPERTPAQVFQRFVHKMGANKKGRFSDKDLKILESYTSKINGPFTQQSLGAILGRDERSIYRRLKIIEREDSTKIKIKWNLKLCEKLLQNLLLVIGKKTKSTVTLKTLRDYKITWNDWIEVGNILELQPLKLKTYWYCKLYVQLFTTHPIYTKDILIKLFSTLKKRQYQYLHEVDWNDIATKFSYVTPMFLWKRFYVFAYTHTPRVKEEFKNLVETFYTDYVVNKKKIRNLRLLQYELTTENKLIMKDRW